MVYIKDDSEEAGYKAQSIDPLHFNKDTYAKYSFSPEEALKGVRIGDQRTALEDLKDLAGSLDTKTEDTKPNRAITSKVNPKA